MLSSTVLVVAIVIALFVGALTVGGILTTPDSRTVTMGRLGLYLALVSAIAGGLFAMVPALEDSGAGFAASVTAIPVLMVTSAVAATLYKLYLGVALSWLGGTAMGLFIAMFFASLGVLYLPTLFLLLGSAVQLQRALRVARR